MTGLMMGLTDRIVPNICTVESSFREGDIFDRN